MEKIIKIPKRYKVVISHLSKEYGETYDVDISPNYSKAQKIKLKFVKI